MRGMEATPLNDAEYAPSLPFMTSKMTRSAYLTEADLPTRFRDQVLAPAARRDHRRLDQQYWKAKLM